MKWCSDLVKAVFILSFTFNFLLPFITAWINSDKHSLKTYFRTNKLTKNKRSMNFRDSFERVSRKVSSDLYKKNFLGLYDMQNMSVTTYEKRGKLAWYVGSKTIDNIIIVLKKTTCYIFQHYSLQKFQLQKNCHLLLVRFGQFRHNIEVKTQI